MNEQLALIYGYLHGMWRYRWSALVVAWLVALLGWVFVFSLPDQFNSKATVYVDTSSVLRPFLKGLTPEADSRDELQVMTRVLLSRANLMSVIRETDMDLEINSELEKEALVESLARDIKMAKGGGGRGSANNIYKISYQSESANRSYKVVSSLLNTMIEDTLNSTRTDTLSAQKFLDTQIAEYEGRLSLAEQRLAKFKKENVGFMPDERGGYYMRLQRAKDEIEEIQSSLRLAERRYSELTSQLNGENPILGSAGFLTANAGKIKKYQEQLNLLLNQYTDQHPDVKALIATIENLKANSAAEADYSVVLGEDEKGTNPVYQEVMVAQSKASVEVETLKIKLSDQQNKVKKLQDLVGIIPEVEAELAKLNRGYKVTNEKYLDLVKRRESAGIAQSAGESASDLTFRVIEPPLVPYKPSGPNRALFLFYALLVAMAAGLTWSFLRYLLKPTFINLTQLSAITGLPTLGSVGLYLSAEHKKRRRLQLATYISATLLLVVVFGVAFVFRTTGTSLLSALLVRI